MAGIAAIMLGVSTVAWAAAPPYDCNEEFWQGRLETLAEKAGLKLP